MKTRSVIGLVLLIGAAFAAFETGAINAFKKDVKRVEAPAPVAPAVSVARVATREFVETALVTGSLVPREEILVAPEVEGLRVLELKVEEGDRVKAGDTLAVLVAEQLEAQMAQSDANMARADAGIARAKSVIAEAEARQSEAAASLERARPLVKSKFLSESVFDQREAAARTAVAQLASARDGLKVAEAEKAQVEAQRRELLWRRGNTEVKAPADGVVSRRGARIGSIAIGAFIAGTGEPMFRIVKDGEVELDAEVAEARLVHVRPGQTARIDVAGLGEVTGTVRLVAPEVDKATRLGRVRIFLGDKPGLRVGAFARGVIETARERGLGVPQAAVLYGEDGPAVQVVEDGRVETRRIVVGLVADGQAEVRSGLKEGELVVARAGTFLREGDGVRPVLPDDKVSETSR